MKNRTCVRIVVAGLSAATGLGASGCGGLGPSVITNGRAQYTEAIASTTDQQTLGAIVRMRYGESFGMLAVTSVTSNMSVKTNAQVQAGIGPESTFAGNLVPLSGGVVYEENPTITYAPVEGAQFLREYLSPIPLEVVVLAARSSRHPSFVLSLLLERINGMWNPGSTAARGSGSGGVGFTRTVQLLELLRTRGELDWGQTEKADSFAILLRVQGQEGASAEMRELIGLLRIDAAETDSGRVVLPLRLSSMDESRGAIDVSTRSVFELLQIAACGVEVPAEDQSGGLAPAGWEAAGDGGSSTPVRVRWSASRVANAAVQVPHRGGWFYIDATDHQSKGAFNIIQTLLVVRARSAVSDGRMAPVLTVPVSK